LLGSWLALATMAALCSKVIRRGWFNNSRRSWFTSLWGSIVLPTRWISPSSLCLMSRSCMNWSFFCIVCTSFSHKVQRNLLNFKSWPICCKQKATNSSKMWKLVGFPCYLQPSDYIQNYILSRSKCMQRVNKMMLQGRI